MSPLRAWITCVGIGLIAFILAGLVARRRIRLWYSFTAYLVAVGVTNLMLTVWPQRFFNLGFWRVQETLHDLLRFVMALELALRTFRAFPGALSTLRWVVLLVLAATFATVVAVAGGSVSDATFVGELHPRVLNGSIWLFTAIAALILWYRLPVHPFHKAVLLSYVPYLLVFTVVLNALGAMTTATWENGWLIRYANQVSYVLMLSYWAYAAWRPQEEVRAAPLPEALHEISAPRLG